MDYVTAGLQTLESDEELKPGEQLDTPRKNKILGAIKFADLNHFRWTKVSMAKMFKVSRMQVDYAVKNPSPRTKKDSALKHKNAQKVSSDDLERVERYIAESDFGGKRLKWDEIAANNQIEVTARHLSDLMKPRLRKNPVHKRNKSLHSSADPRRASATGQFKKAPASKRKRPARPQPEQAQPVQNEPEDVQSMEAQPVEAELMQVLSVQVGSMQRQLGHLYETEAPSIG